MKNWKSGLLKYVGLIVMFTGVVFLVFQLDNPTLASIGIGVISFGVATMSIGVAIDNANVNFLQAVSDFEKARIKFLRRRDGYTIEAYIWRSRTHLERACELDKSIIKTKYHYRLVDYFIKSLQALFNRKSWDKLEPNQRKNIIEMYSIVRDYKRNNGNESDLMTLLENNMGKRQDESEFEFNNRIRPPKKR